MAVSPYRAKRIYLSLSEHQFDQELDAARAKPAIRLCRFSLLALGIALIICPLIVLVALLPAVIQLPLALRLVAGIIAIAAMFLWPRWVAGRTMDSVAKVVTRRTIRGMLAQIQRQAN